LPVGGKTAGNTSSAKVSGVVEKQLKDGSRYVGGWLNDQPEGRGHLWLDQGGEYIGAFSKGEFRGFGRFFWPDGSSFEGTWEGPFLASGMAVLTNGTRRAGVLKKFEFVEFSSQAGPGEQKTHSAQAATPSEERSFVANRAPDKAEQVSASQNGNLIAAVLGKTPSEKEKPSTAGATGQKKPGATLSNGAASQNSALAAILGGGTVTTATSSNAQPSLQPRVVTPPLDLNADTWTYDPDADHDGNMTDEEMRVYNNYHQIWQDRKLSRDENKRQQEVARQQEEIDAAKNKKADPSLMDTINNGKAVMDLINVLK
jgi:hypothetical protein